MGTATRLGPLSLLANRQHVSTQNLLVALRERSKATVDANSEPTQHDQPPFEGGIQVTWLPKELRSGYRGLRFGARRRAFKL